MAADDKDMSEFEKRLDRIELAMEQTLQQNAETSRQIGELVSIMRVKEERERRQEEINEELKGITKDHDSRIKAIEIDRATEKPSRDFISKNLPILALLVALAYLLMTELASKYSSTIIP